MFQNILYSHSPLWLGSCRTDPTSRFCCMPAHSCSGIVHFIKWNESWAVLLPFLIPARWKTSSPTWTSKRIVYPSLHGATRPVGKWVWMHKIYWKPQLLRKLFGKLAGITSGALTLSKGVLVCTIYSFHFLVETVFKWIQMIPTYFEPHCSGSQENSTDLSMTWDLGYMFGCHQHMNRYKPHLFSQQWVLFAKCGCHPFPLSHWGRKWWVYVTKLRSAGRAICQISRTD